MTDNKLSEQHRWTQAVVKMIKMTQKGKLIWHKDKKFPAPSDEIITNIYTTIYNQKRLRIYKRQYKKDISLFDTIAAMRETTAGWNTEVVLEFVTDQTDESWKFPQSAPIKDLLSAIQYQVSGVNDFLNQILNEED